MKYLLDTNMCIRFINGRVPHIRTKVLHTPPLDMVLCSVVKAEMLTGSAKSQHPEQSRAVQLEFFSRFQSLPFDDTAAAIYGDIRAHLEKLGTPIGSNDLMIAAIALTHDLVLVTHNLREFERVPHLRLEDWELG